MDSLILEAADATAVPAGGALAVDRNAFSIRIEEMLAAQPGLELVRGEVSEIPRTSFSPVRARFCQLARLRFLAKRVK